MMFILQDSYCGDPLLRLIGVFVGFIIFLIVMKIILKNSDKLDRLLDWWLK
jgi:hypothetical protein